jgi:hypothetical protein
MCLQSVDATLARGAATETTTACSHESLIMKLHVALIALALSSWQMQAFVLSPVQRHSQRYVVACLSLTTLITTIELGSPDAATIHHVFINDTQDYSTVCQE